MAFIYTYTKSQCKPDKLYIEIESSLFLSPININYDFGRGENNLDIFFRDSLNPGEITTLNNIVNLHFADKTKEGNFDILSASTSIYSAGTELSLIIDNIASTYSSTGSSNTSYVQPGTNTYTGGTINRPTVNISALTVNSIIISGDAKIHSSIGSGSISATTNINNVLTPSGAFVTILRDDNNIISGLTKSLGIYGMRNFAFNRNSENKITGWTVN